MTRSWTDSEWHGSHLRSCGCGLLSLSSKPFLLSLIGGLHPVQRADALWKGKDKHLKLIHYRPKSLKIVAPQCITFRTSKLVFSKLNYDPSEETHFRQKTQDIRQKCELLEKNVYLHHIPSTISRCPWQQSAALAAKCSHCQGL